jgi:hypothetical protein
MRAKRALEAIVLASALALAVPVAAQTTVSSADIQRLQDDVYQASSDISRLRGGNSGDASRMQDELDTLREEVIYLKVKLRKEGSVSRSDYADVRNRLQDLRTRARGDSGTWRNEPAPVGDYPSGNSSGRIYDPERPSTSSNGRTLIPAGQEIDVRLQSQLTSDTAQPEDRFEATTVVDLYEGNRVLVPAGSTLRGVVSSVNKATRTDRKGSLTVAFDQITVRGRSYPMRGTVTQALESEGIKGEVAKIGAGSAVGAIIGGIIGGVKGAVIGVLVGGGGTIAATEGKDVKLDQGTILRVRLDNPPDIR